MKHIYIFLFSVIFTNSFAFAQKNDPFDRLDKSKIKTGILYDKVKLPVSKIKLFKANNKEFISNPEEWRQIYGEIRQASFQKNIPEIISLKGDIKPKIRKNIFPVGILNFKYNQLKKDALKNGLIKISNKKIIALKDDIYSENTLFGVSLIDTKEYTGKKVTFDFSENYYFSNYKSVPNYFTADFNDGTGEQKIKAGDRVTIKYNTDGIKSIKIKLVLKSGKTFSSGFKVKISTPKMPTPSETWTDYTADIPYNGVAAHGEVGVFFGNGNSDFTRPVIIVDGFDPGDTRDIAGLWDIANQQNMVDNLRAEGYDFVITNFYGGDDYIQRNAMLVVKLIQDINTRMTAAGTMKPANQIVVIGPSMGGLITRYAIRYLEENNIPHNVRNWISFDSPQKGADIPLGLQHWVRFFAQEADVESAQEALTSLSGPAAKQMLIYHYTATSGNTANSNGLFTSFYNEINAMGFPEQTRIVSIINGSGYGNGQPYNPGDQVIYYHYRSWVVDLDGNVWAVPNQSNIRIFNGLYDTALPFDEVNENIYVNNTLPYDGAPGGSRATFAEMDAIDPGYGDIQAPWDNHAFIPTISSLCLQNTTDPYYNVNANINSIVTPFDRIYYPNTNQEHVAITPESYNWFYHEVINFTPQFTSVPITSVDEDSQYSYTLTASDENEWNTLSYELIEKPGWLNFDTNTGIFSGTPLNEDVGTYTVSVKVTDGLDESTQTFTITVNNTNDAPVFTSTPVETATEDSPYSYTVSATDEDPTGDILTFSAAQIPDWLTFDENTKTLSGTPLNEDVGTSDVIIRVNDGTVDVDQSFTITVQNTNDAPVFTSTPLETATEDSPYSYTVSATDEDPTGDILTFSAAQIPDWLTFDENTKTLSGTPLNEDVGTSDVIIRVNDGTVDVDQSFTITVQNTNDAPVFYGNLEDKTTLTGINFNYTFDENCFKDVDTNDNLHYNTVLSDGSDLPDWLTFNAETRTFEGIPYDIQVLHIKIIATDDSSASASGNFVLTVNENNTAENASDDEFKIYPNPAQDYIYFNLPYNKNPYIFDLYDINGKKLISRELFSKEENKISVNKLSGGIYIAKLRLSEREIIRKIVVK